VPESGEILHRRLHAEEALAAGVGFVAAHHGGPLLARHGSRAGIRQQVYQNVLGIQEEKIVACLFEVLLALGGGSTAKGFDTLDAERLDDCLHHPEV